MLPPVLRFVLVAALCLSAATAHAQTAPSVEVTPAQPVAGEPVYAVYDLGHTCTGQVDLAATQVEFEQGTISVRLKLRPDFLEIGCDSTFRQAIELGQFPAGAYRVSVGFAEFPNPPHTISAAATRAEASFLVAAVTSPNRPLNNVSGMWWSPLDSGWSLSLYQQPDRRLLASWATYDNSGAAVWFFLLPGEWTALNTYEAPIAKATHGPFYGRQFLLGQLPAMVPDAEIVGTARLFFSLSAPVGADGSFAYTVSGVSTVRLIQKFTF